MISIPNRSILFAVIFTSVFSSGCKDDNILNAYLNFTKQNRIEETANLSSYEKIINITVYDSKSNELLKEANVTLKLPNGIILSRKTNSSGNIKFILEKSITGICEINTESKENFYKDKTNLEIFETFNYNLSIYIKE